MLRSGRGIGDISTTWFNAGKADCCAARSTTALTCAKPALPLATSASMDVASKPSVTLWRCASLFRSTTRPSSRTATTVGPPAPTRAVARRMPILPASGVTTRLSCPFLTCACARFCPINMLPTAADAPTLIKLRRLLSILVSLFIYGLIAGHSLPELPVCFKRLQQPIGKSRDGAIGLALLRIEQPVGLLERLDERGWCDQQALLQGVCDQRCTRQRDALAGDGGVHRGALLIEHDAVADLARFALRGKPVRPRLTVIDVQQIGSGDIVDRAQPCQRRRAYRQQKFVAQARTRQARPRSFAIADRHVDVFTDEVGVTCALLQPQCELGMQYSEGAQARHQPFGGKVGRGGDRQASAGACIQRARAAFEAIKGIADDLEIASPGIGQQQLIGQAIEQRQAELIFERLDLMTDGARGHIEFLRRQRETLMPRRCLKGAQGGERRKFASRHRDRENFWG